MNTPLDLDTIKSGYNVQPGSPLDALIAEVERLRKENEMWDADNLRFREHAIQLETRLAVIVAEEKKLRDSLTRIDSIRNSIIGHQTVHWSAHIYPLVAALKDAGFEGLGYEVAKKIAERAHELMVASSARGHKHIGYVEAWERAAAETSEDAPAPKPHFGESVRESIEADCQIEPAITEGGDGTSRMGG